MPEEKNNMCVTLVVPTQTLCRSPIQGTAYSVAVNSARDDRFRNNGRNTHCTTPDMQGLRRQEHGAEVFAAPEDILYICRAKAPAFPKHEVLHCHTLSPDLPTLFDYLAPARRTGTL